MKRLLLLLLFASCTHTPIPEPIPEHNNLVTVPPADIPNVPIFNRDTMFIWNSFGDASYQFDSYFEVTGIAMNGPAEGVTVSASSTWGSVKLFPDSMIWETGNINIRTVEGFEFFANDIQPLRDDLHMEMTPSLIRIWSDNDTVSVKILSISLRK